MSQLTVENVRDYPRPPVLTPVPHSLRVLFAGDTVVQTSRAVRVLETHHAPTYYMPREDACASLTATGKRSFCEWKGLATYWDVTQNGKTATNAAWSYEDPTNEFAAIKGFIAIYASAMEACFVGEEKVIPQPGNFYGGWVTGNLRGQIKGAPGTEGW